MSNLQAYYNSYCFDIRDFDRKGDNAFLGKVQKEQPWRSITITILSPKVLKGENNVHLKEIVARLTIIWCAQVAGPKEQKLRKFLIVHQQYSSMWHQKLDNQDHTWKHIPNMGKKYQVDVLQKYHFNQEI